MDAERSPAYYRLPDDTDRSVRTLVLALAAFLALLLAAVALVFWQAEALASRIPFAAEQRFVRPYEALIGRAFADERGDPAVGHYLQELSDALRDAMDVPETITVRVHYVDSNKVNAFATLGGHVVVYRGLVEALPDENSLAMVLAHEIAHVAHRDPVAGVGRGLALQMLFGFVTGGGGTDAGNFVDLLGGSGLALFGREQERRADIAALHALARHYGHVGGYRTFLETALAIENETAGPGRGPVNAGDDVPLVDWLSSHPATAERLRLLDEARRAAGFASGATLALPETPFGASRARIGRGD